MFASVASSLMASTSSLLLARGCTIPAGEASTTLYISDTQFQHLGPYTFQNNPLIRKVAKWFLMDAPPDRNVIKTQTAPLYTHELLRQVLEELREDPAVADQPERISTIILGDMADTPTKSEYDIFEKILNMLELSVDIFVRGNHSSNNAFGVVNLQSRLYRMFRDMRKMELESQFSLRHEVEIAAGHKDNVLSDEGTFESIHNVTHRHRSESAPGLKAINRQVVEADRDGFRLKGGEKHNYNSEGDAKHRDKVFDLLWKASEPSDGELCAAKPYWECLVNSHLADLEEGERDAKVTPFYIQASEQARFQLEDGTEVPVYTISLDGLDNNFLFPAMHSELSMLQIRAVETFMDQMRARNPRAKFKIASHYSSQDLLKPPLIRRWRGRHERRALRNLLRREEVILFTYGHSHAREDIDLNEKLKLKRNSPLRQINVPSLIDYHPVEEKAPKHPEHPYKDARALLIEKMYISKDEQGREQVQLDLRFRGINYDDLTKAGMTHDTSQAVTEYRVEHGYTHSIETMQQLRKKHLAGWRKSHRLRAWEAFTIGCNIFRPLKALHYWFRTVSIAKYGIDNFTVVSTVKMYSEAFHLLSFMGSLIEFIRQDAGEDPEQLAAAAQLESLRVALLNSHDKKYAAFKADMERGERPAQLRTHNDLFKVAETHKLSELLLELATGSQARLFSVLAGIQASKAEFEAHKEKPTTVPNQLQPIIIPVDR